MVTVVPNVSLKCLEINCAIVHLVCAERIMCLFWALRCMKSIQKDDVDDYRIHDSASCTFRMVLLVLLVAASTPLVCLLKLMFVLFCCVRLLLYIVGVCMCVLVLVLMVSCVFVFHFGT